MSGFLHETLITGQAHAENMNEMSSEDLSVEDFNDEESTVEKCFSESNIYLKAINPGYKTNGISNVGEMIEIARCERSDVPILLAGTMLGYTNSSGTFLTMIEFPENSWMVGETILLRLASSPERELAAMNYTVKGSSAGIGQNAGPLALIQNGEIIDEVCWTGKDGCERKFKSGSGESMVRNMETGEWLFLLNYEPEFDPNAYYAEELEEEYAEDQTSIPSQCKGLEFSEILSYYESSKAEQFIELHNASINTIKLDGCKIRYKNKNYMLGGFLEPDGYYAYYPVGFSLTKNPTSSNKIEIIDTDGAIVDILEYPNGQRRATAYAWIGYDGEGKKIWKTTYAPTPGAPNNYQEFKSCEAGKVINKTTGNCVKVTSVSEKICKEGYYLNTSTGRCKKKETTTEKVCKEGYYLNPETNRCRKIKENKGADYSLKPEEYKDESSFVGLYAVLGVLGAGGVYLIYEFRNEIGKLCRRVFRRSR